MTAGEARQVRARVALVWFRQDLRLADHRPLTEALARADSVLAVYVHDERAAGRWAPGGAGLWWLHHSLAALGQSLREAGGKLVLRRGDAATIIPELARQAGATEVHCGLAHEPWLRALDTEVADTLTHDGVGLHAHRVSTLFDLDRIRTKTGGVYGVYTPFANTCRNLPPPPAPLPAPKCIPAAEGDWQSDRLEDWGLLPTKPDWAGGMRSTWQPGEAGAHARVARFLADHLDGYHESRDAPADEDGTSMLSPHLHWGEISATQVWHAALDASAEGSRGTGFERFQGELLWHEFAAYLLWNRPSMPEQPLRPAFARLRWRQDPDAMRAWQRGQTGVPIVDAGMRQLWQIGWMHNRVRMITASLLVKHLLVSWQDGEAWFWDTLVDGDLATNAASWQWVAGCGTDAQPFFRIFNPVTQSRKFDPDGVYIRRWVPEVAKLPDRFLHAPWDAPPAELARAGITLGKTYPMPVIALDEGRDRALAAFRQVRAEAREEALEAVPDAS
jgi:deoxyribodipyrimidine photo-lyase